MRVPFPLPSFSKAAARPLESSRTGLRPGWMLLYLVLTTGFIYACLSNRAYDDPFITYRYAENLARGAGLVYNPGERVLSTTTPLFALLLAGLHPFWEDLPHLANLIGALSLAAGALFLWDLAGTWQAKPAGWAGLLLFPTFSLFLLTLGSETPLYLAFCLGSFAFYARGRYAAAAALSALAVLTRPDGLLVPALLAADFILRIRRPIPWRAVVIFLALLLPWVVFAWIYYGSPLPATLAAKQQQGSMAASEGFGRGFFTILGWFTAWHYPLEAFLALLGLLFAAARGRAWLLILAWPVVYFASYSALGVSRYFWYYAPLAPGFIAAVGLGITGLDRLLRRGENGQRHDALSGDPAVRQRQAFTLRYSPAIFTAGLLLVLAAAQGSAVLRLRQYPDQRYAVYRTIGEWLAANTQTGEAVGALEVGIIGYYAQRQMVDFAGLIQPAVSEQLSAESTFEDAALWAVRRYQPAYLVLEAGVFPRLEQVYVAQECVLQQNYPPGSHGYTGDLSIYRCSQKN